MATFTFYKSCSNDNLQECDVIFAAPLRFLTEVFKWKWPPSLFSKLNYLIQLIVIADEVISDQ